MAWIFDECPRNPLLETQVIVKFAMKNLKLVLMVIFFLLAGVAQAQVPAHLTIASQPIDRKSVV